LSILITGGAGFLGSVVAEELLSQIADDIVLFDITLRRMNYMEEHSNRVQIVKGDITNFDEIMDFCRQFNIKKVVHLAAIADVDLAEREPLRACDINVKGTYNIFEVCRRLDAERVVFASTGGIYGKTRSPVPEESPYGPTDIYGATKVVGEVIATQYAKSYGIDILVDRLYYLYGPGMFFEPISPFVMVKNSVEGKSTVFEMGGDQQFDFTHVRDAANGIVLSLLSDRGRLKHRVFNISSGKRHSLYELGEIVKKYVPEADIRIGPGEMNIPRSSQLDVSRAKHELGYEPKIEFEDGVKETIMWLLRKR